MESEKQAVRLVTDELAIRNLAGAFSDAVNRRDFQEFRSLWAPDGVWEILDPLPARAQGVDEIESLVRKLLTGRDFFVQMTHEGVVHLHGETAAARWTEEELGRGPSRNFYHNYALYEDEFIRLEEGWRFQKRTYRYLYLDHESLNGTAFEPGEFPKASH